MRAVEQAKPTENSAPAAQQSGFHAELHAMWGPPPMLKQAGEFLAGVGEGFRNAVNEGAKAAAQVVTHPGETVSAAAKGTVDVVKTGLSASVAAGEYIGSHLESGDVQGVVHDAKKTGQVIGRVAAEAANHLSHMKAHDLGKFVGHDVLPGAIAAVVVPELAGEGIALAASASSKLGTLAKEGEVLSKAANVYEHATAKISAISEKFAGLNKKMEALQHDVRCTQKLDGEGFEHLQPPRRHKNSPVSDAFHAHVQECQTKLEPWVRKHLENEKIEIHTVGKIADLPEGIGAGRERIPACTLTDGPHKGIYIAEEVWHEGKWTTHNPVDVLFNMFHEAGHAINATFRTDNLSNSKEFAKLFDAIWENVDQTKGAAKVVADLKTKDRMRDEVMADMWGHLHATPHVNNDYSNTLRKLFAPIYDHMKEWRLG